MSNFCAICDRPGYLIECSKCARSYHLICINDDPKLERDWKCAECKPIQYPLIKNRFFSDLLRIPTVTTFQLPEYIQKLSKIEKWGVIESSGEPKGEADEYTLCFVCSFGGVGRKLIQCEACKDWYHHDCLTPPIIIEPQNFCCPKHVHQLMSDRYYTESVSLPALKNTNLIQVRGRPKENAEALESFGVIEPLYLPGEAIRNQFLKKLKDENKDMQLLTNQDLAKNYLKSLESFTSNAIETVKKRFCLDDESLRSSFRKVEELNAIIEVN
eukprot:NODE_419_length_7785_cov_0.861158.p4 type:complete len:271 gc:universal NODE_419_length_7785_cov_0.861158:687-1499(+)